MQLRPRPPLAAVDRAVALILLGSPALVVAVGLLFAGWISSARIHEDALLQARTIGAVAASLLAAGEAGSAFDPQAQRTPRDVPALLHAVPGVRAAALLSAEGRPLPMRSGAPALAAPSEAAPAALLTEAASTRSAVAQLMGSGADGAARSAAVVVPIARADTLLAFLHLEVELRRLPEPLGLASLWPLIAMVAICAGLAAVPGWWLVRRLARLRAEVAESRRLALHDSLTGLPNRLLFADRFQQAMARHRRQGGHGALVLLDLDDFKAINDRFGHAGGDELLQAVARRLRACVRGSDTVARLGGDEFALLLEPPAGEAALAAVLARIRSGFARAFRVNGQLVGMGASIGIARFPDQGEELEGLLRLADSALYRDKTRLARPSGTSAPQAR